ncbi:MAG: hypothetical protein V2G44_05370, partial [bacterium JZ-2024 1]
QRGFPCEMGEQAPYEVETGVQTSFRLRAMLVSRFPRYITVQAPDTHKNPFSTSLLLFGGKYSAVELKPATASISESR